MAKLACAFVVAVMLASPAARAQCAKTASGQPYATGTGDADPAAETAGLRRLGAERAAFLDALAKLHACLGAKASGVTGWSLAAVRYFDSDPIVEVDVAATFDQAPRIAVLGSALPNIAREMRRGSNIKRLRLSTTRAAKVMAERNAAEALNVVFPAGGKTGDVRQVVAGAIGGCATTDIAYWSDQAVSVKLICGKAVAHRRVKPHPAPKIEKHKP